VTAPLPDGNIGGVPGRSLTLYPLLGREQEQDPNQAPPHFEEKPQG
jgi:hypothetical protein